MIYNDILEHWLPKPVIENEFRDFKGIIYRIINLINGKVYIGKSSNSFNKRYASGEWWKRTHNQYLKEDYSKYGPEAFKAEVFEHGFNDSDLSQLEIILIYSHNSLYPNGYNLVMPEGSFSERTKENMSKAAKQRFATTNHPFKTQIFTPKMHQKQAASLRGRKLPEEQKRKISIWTQANKYKFESPVHQIDRVTNQIINSFPSITQASKATGVSSSVISRECQASILASKGFIWRYQDGSSPEFIRKAGDFPRKSVLQIDPQTDAIIQTFSSAAEAAKATGSERSKISAVCCGRRNKHNGYIWKFVK